MTEMHTANDVSPPILHLAESGDVILQLGRNKGPQSSMSLLVVSPAKLRAASPVFAVMFDGRFMEGQGLTPAAPRVVPLPDDNLQHILSICKAIHGTDVGTCYCNGFDDLVDFATTADKYDCAAAIFELSRTFVLRRMAAPQHAFFAKVLSSSLSSSNCRKSSTRLPKK
ncbi:hypothetical protein J1614_000321 [Plenodomus biglobosus]|nr:hypothetical protein J1614_000321 [Plenodomus biglobosus]